MRAFSGWPWQICRGTSLPELEHPETPASRGGGGQGGRQMVRWPWATALQEVSGSESSQGQPQCGGLITTGFTLWPAGAGRSFEKYAGQTSGRRWLKVCGLGPCWKHRVCKNLRLVLTGRHWTYQPQCAAQKRVTWGPICRGHPWLTFMIPSSCLLLLFFLTGLYWILHLG